MSQTKLYKIHKNIAGENVCIAKKGEPIGDGIGTNMLYIPFEEENIDYQEYLKWVAEGNTPEAAD